MADAGIDYEVLHAEKELEIKRHRDTIARGQARISDIERQKELNLETARIHNLRLDSEAKNIEVNEKSLEAKIAEIEADLAAMVKGKGE